MSDPDETSDNIPQITPNPMNFSADFAKQLAEFMRQSLSSSKPPNNTSDHPETLDEVHLKTKLNGDNYPLWAKLMERAIGGKGLTSHILGVSDPPPKHDPNYLRWQQRDHCCFNWVINNVEADLVNDVSQYATARDLWEGLAIAYGSGTDPFQTYDLLRQANMFRQGDLTLEALWVKMIDLWITIDARDPSPFTIQSQIEIDKKRTQRNKVYQFLAALDDKYDAIKREIINRDPLPTVREAYGIVRRSAMNERVMKPATVETKGLPSGVGAGLATIDRNRAPPPKYPANSRMEEDKSNLTCDHCGGRKHTKETCFLIHGYPEWWDDMKKARQQRMVARGGRSGGGGGRASSAVATGN